MKILVKNAAVFTGINATSSQMSLAFDDETGRFIAADLDEASYDEVRDFQGRYIMPGMINSHVHVVMDASGVMGGISSSSSFATNEAVMGAVAYQNLRDILKSGVTYVRDQGSKYDIDLVYDKIERAGLMQLPGIIGSGPALAMTGGHGSKELGLESDGVDELRKHARLVIKNGARNVKLMATGGISIDGEKPTDVQLSYDEMKAAVDEAHKKGYTASAHAQGNQGIKNAVRAGVDSIEHGIYLDDEAIEMMLAQGTFLVPTLMAPYAIFENGDKLPDFMVNKTKEAMQPHVESIRLAAKRGVKIAMGTDAGTPYNDFVQGSLRELELMREADMSPLEILKSATINAAQLLKVDHEAGSIEVGKLADFIVLKADPLADVSNLKGSKEVYKKGRLVV